MIAADLKVPFEGNLTRVDSYSAHVGVYTARPARLASRDTLDHCEKQAYRPEA